MQQSQKHTIAEVEKISDHAELINGKLVIEDKTTVTHNLVISEIATALRNFISSNEGKCKVFTENVALYCNELLNDEKNFFLPDVMVVCDEKGFDDAGVHTAPLFIAEVTSEATKMYDFTEKALVYREIGVSEYWIVDIQKKIVYKYLSSEGFIPTPFLYPESVKVSSYPGLAIDLSAFMIH